MGRFARSYAYPLKEQSVKYKAPDTSRSRSAEMAWKRPLQSPGGGWRMQRTGLLGKQYA